MTTYYIDLSAGTNGSGTTASPYNAIPASSTLSDGDTWAFLRGTDGTVTYNTAESGVAYRYIAKNNITIRAYYNADGTDDTTKAKPIIRVVRQTTSGGASFLRFNGAFSGWTVKNLHFIGPICSQVLTCSNGGGTIVVDGVEVYDHLYLSADNVGAPGLTNTLVFGTSSPVTSVTLRNCIVDGTGDDNCVVSGTLALVEDCRLSEPGRSSATVGDCISNSCAGSGCVTTLRRNVFTKSSTSTKQCYINNVNTGSTNYIYDNTFNMGSNFGNNAIVGVSIDGNAGYVFRNRFVGGRQALYMVNAGTTGFVRSNTFITDEVDGQASSSYIQIAQTIDFSHNTVVNTNGASGNAMQAALDMNKTGSATASTATHNVFIGWDTAIRKTSSASTESDNAFWDVTEPIRNRANEAAITADASDITSDPGVSATYHPVEGSVLIAAGTHTAYLRDASGAQFNNPPSLGAYEYVAARTARV